MTTNMRIITGTARGIELETLEGLETRPTSARVKEALFSMIQFDIEGRRVLDLFAGSGQLGLEALSRGAKSCVFIDSSRQAAETVLKNASKAKLREGCTVSAYDYEAFLKSKANREKYDLIFLDPPYNTDCMTKALGLIAEGNILEVNGIIVCETDTETDERKRRAKKSDTTEEDVLCDVFGGSEELKNRFVLKKSTRYGRTRITLLTL